VKKIHEGETRYTAQTAGGRALSKTTDTLLEGQSRWLRDYESRPERWEENRLAVQDNIGEFTEGMGFIGFFSAVTFGLVSTAAQGTAQTVLGIIGVGPVALMFAGLGAMATIGAGSLLVKIPNLIYKIARNQIELGKEGGFAKEEPVREQTPAPERREREEHRRFPPGREGITQERVKPAEPHPHPAGAGRTPSGM